MGYAPPIPPPRRITPPNAGSPSWLANHPNGPLAQNSMPKPPPAPSVPPGWPGTGAKPPDPNMQLPYMPPGDNKALPPAMGWGPPGGQQPGLIYPTGAGTMPPSPTYPPQQAPQAPAPQDRTAFSGSAYQPQQQYQPPQNAGQNAANRPAPIGSHVNQAGQTIANQGGQANRAAMTTGLLGNMGQQPAPGGTTWADYAGGENMQGLTVDPRMFHPNSPFAQRAASPTNPNWGTQPLQQGPGPNANAQHIAHWNDPGGILDQRDNMYNMWDTMIGGGNTNPAQLTSMMGLSDRPHPLLDQYYAARGIDPSATSLSDQVNINGTTMTRAYAESQGLIEPSSGPQWTAPSTTAMNETLAAGGYSSYGQMLLDQSRAAGFPNAPTDEPTGPDLSYQGETPDQEAGNPGGANSGYNGGGMSIEPWLQSGPGYLPYNPQEGDQQYHDGLPPYGPPIPAPTGPPRRKPASAFNPNDPSTYGNQGPLDPSSLAGGRRRMRANGR